MNVSMYILFLQLIAKEFGSVCSLEFFSHVEACMFFGNEK